MPVIVVASTNPVKLEAARRGFARMFPGESFTFEAFKTSSGVADQPKTNRETITGARNRAENAARLAPHADFWVGIEGGVEPEGEDLSAFAWVVVLSREQSGRGRSATFYLPDRVARLVHEGKELGEADDIVFGRTNSKQENGAVGLLTDDAIDRAELYEQAVVMALIPFKNPQFYPPTFPLTD